MRYYPTQYYQPWLTHQIHMVVRSYAHRVVAHASPYTLTTSPHITQMSDFCLATDFCAWILNLDRVTRTHLINTPPATKGRTFRKHRLSKKARKRHLQCLRSRCDLPSYHL